MVGLSAVVVSSTMVAALVDGFLVVAVVVVIFTRVQSPHDFLHRSRTLVSLLQLTGLAMTPQIFDMSSHTSNSTVKVLLVVDEGRLTQVPQYLGQRSFISELMQLPGLKAHNLESSGNESHNSCPFPART